MKNLKGAFFLSLVFNYSIFFTCCSVTCISVILMHTELTSLVIDHNWLIFSPGFRFASISIIVNRWLFKKNSIKTCAWYMLWTSDHAPSFLLSETWYFYISLGAGYDDGMSQAYFRTLFKYSVYAVTLRGYTYNLYNLYKCISLKLTALYLYKVFL